MILQCSYQPWFWRCVLNGFNLNFSDSEEESSDSIVSVDSDASTDSEPSSDETGDTVFSVRGLEMMKRRKITWKKELEARCGEAKLMVRDF